MAKKIKDDDFFSINEKKDHIVLNRKKDRGLDFYRGRSYTIARYNIILITLAFIFYAMSFAVLTFELDSAFVFSNPKGDAIIKQ